MDFDMVTLQSDPQRHKFVIPTGPPYIICGIVRAFGKEELERRVEPAWRKLERDRRNKRGLTTS